VNLLILRLIAAYFPVTCVKNCLLLSLVAVCYRPVEHQSELACLWVRVMRVGNLLRVREMVGGDLRVAICESFISGLARASPSVETLPL
jgi:hypothetical protein